MPYPPQRVGGLTAWESSRNHITDELSSSCSMSTPNRPVHISYNAEDDYLEVVLSDSAGNVEATGHPAIDQAVDDTGSLVGFWIKDISKLANSGSLEVHLESRAATGGAYSVTEIRKEHPNAYAKWTPIEDHHLAEAFKSGVTISTLAKSHNRKEGAIRSRLQKLGLIGL